MANLSFHVLPPPGTHLSAGAFSFLRVWNSALSFPGA